MPSSPLRNSELAGTQPKQMVKTAGNIRCCCGSKVDDLTNLDPRWAFCKQALCRVTKLHLHKPTPWVRGVEDFYLAQKRLCQQCVCKLLWKSLSEFTLIKAKQNTYNAMQKTNPACHPQTQHINKKVTFHTPGKHTSQGQNFMAPLPGVFSSFNSATH